MTTQAISYCRQARKRQGILKRQKMLMALCDKTHSKVRVTAGSSKCFDRSPSSIYSESIGLHFDDGEGYQRYQMVSDVLPIEPYSPPLTHHCQALLHLFQHIVTTSFKDYLAGSDPAPSNIIAAFPILYQCLSSPLDQTVSHVVYVSGYIFTCNVAVHYRVNHISFFFIISK